MLGLEVLVVRKLVVWILVVWILVVWILVDWGWVDVDGRLEMPENVARSFEAAVNAKRL